MKRALCLINMSTAGMLVNIMIKTIRKSAPVLQKNQSGINSVIKHPNCTALDNKHISLKLPPAPVLDGIPWVVVQLQKHKSDQNSQN